MIKFGLFPDEVVFESVRRDDVDLLAEQVATFTCREVADRCKAVHVAGCDLFQRMFGHDIEPAGLIVGIQTGHVAVERQPVTGDAATHNRCMGREDRRNIRRVVEQIQAAACRHPFVEMCYDPVGRRAEIVDVAFDYLSCSGSEEYGFDVVPLPANRVDAVALPQIFQNVVFAGDELAEIDQYRYGIALNLPASDLHTDVVVGQERLFPIFQKFGILLEFEIYVFSMNIGADQNVPIAQLTGQCQHFGRNHRVDAADLVAHLPADFEQIVRNHF